MRNALFVVSVFVLSLVLMQSESWAQSGSRGSSSRGMRSGGGIPSRIGGARSKTIPSGARPTGMMNSANAVRRTGGIPSGGGSSRRPTTGLSGSSYPRSLGNSGGVRPSTGLSRPSRRSSSTKKTSGNSYATPTTTLPGYRTWTDASGRFSIQGKLAGVRDGTVWIRRADGKLAKLGLSQLSPSDQQFLQTNG